MTDNAQFELPPQDVIHTDLRALFLAGVRTTLEALLEEEIRTLIGARRWQRLAGRKDVRNGSYMRRLLTSLGYLEVAVPRTRESGSAGAVLGRYQRRTQEVDDAIVTAYVHGVSTRKVSKVTEALMGAPVGRSTVSRVTQELEAQVDGLRRAPIEGPIPYLFLDATFLDARWARSVENVAALVAYGVDMDGKRCLLAITIGAQESEASWAELLGQLVERGLQGVRLVIADDHSGLAKAARRYLPEAQYQRCIVHLERNVLAKVPQRLRKRLGREVSAVFSAPSPKQARERLGRLKRTWSAQLPEAVQCLSQGFAAATRFYAFPRAHWSRIRSTNGLERLHGEIKRRTRAVGAFPDRASALRLITAVALSATGIWADRRYLDMNLLRDLPEPKSRKEDLTEAA
jgi:putative transposase